MFDRLFKRASRKPVQEEGSGITFTTDIGPKRIKALEVKVGEFASFLNFAVKYCDREVMAIGTGEFHQEEALVRITSLYPVKAGSAGSVVLFGHEQRELDRLLDRWNESDEMLIIHSHPGFTSRKSSIDDGRGIRMASLLFGGKAVMAIVDPFSGSGVDISAYAINPETKEVERINFGLVP